MNSTLQINKFKIPELEIDDIIISKAFNLGSAKLTADSVVQITVEELKELMNEYFETKSKNTFEAIEHILRGRESLDKEQLIKIRKLLLF